MSQLWAACGRVQEGVPRVWESRLSALVLCVCAHYAGVLLAAWGPLQPSAAFEGPRGINRRGGVMWDSNRAAGGRKRQPLQPPLVPPNVGAAVLLSNPCLSFESEREGACAWCDGRMGLRTLHLKQVGYPAPLRILQLRRGAPASSILPHRLSNPSL